MTRDDDYIRELLLEAEATDQPCIIAFLSTAAKPEELKRYVHIQWLCDDGLFTKAGNHTVRITSQGHDYLAAIRDEGAWKKTKEVAASMGGVTLDMMKKIAVAALEEKLKEVGRRFGLPV